MVVLPLAFLLDLTTLPLALAPPVVAPEWEPLDPVPVAVVVAVVVAVEGLELVAPAGVGVNRLEAAAWVVPVVFCEPGETELAALYAAPIPATRRSATVNVAANMARCRRRGIGDSPTTHCAHCFIPRAQFLITLPFSTVHRLHGSHQDPDRSRRILRV